MKRIAFYFSLAVVMVACGSAKKVQIEKQVITKSDTGTVVAIKENTKGDSSVLIKEVYNSIIKNKFNYSTFNAKVRLSYNSKEGSDDATAYVRLKKDSAVWISLRGPLGIEGFRVLITRDSVKVMDLLKKTIQVRSIGFIKEMTGLPFDLLTIQDLITGNPVFTDNNIIGHKTINNELQVIMQGQFFRHLLTVDKNDFKLLHSKLEDLNGTQRSCNLDYNGYDNRAGFLFSTDRKIAISAQSNIDISLDFKEFTFNQAVTFPFNIQKNYKRI